MPIPLHSCVKYAIKSVIRHFGIICSGHYFKQSYPSTWKFHASALLFTNRRHAIPKFIRHTLVFFLMVDVMSFQVSIQHTIH